MECAGLSEPVQLSIVAAVSAVALAWIGAHRPRTPARVEEKVVADNGSHPSTE